MYIKEFVELMTDQHLPEFLQSGGKFFLGQILYVTKKNGKIVIINTSF